MPYKHKVLEVQYQSPGVFIWLPITEVAGFDWKIRYEIDESEPDPGGREITVGRRAVSGVLHLRTTEGILNLSLAIEENLGSVTSRLRFTYESGRTGSPFVRRTFNDVLFFTEPGSFASHPKEPSEGEPAIYSVPWQCAIPRLGIDQLTRWTFEESVSDPT